MLPSCLLTCKEYGFASDWCPSYCHETYDETSPASHTTTAPLKLSFNVIGTDGENEKPLSSDQAISVLRRPSTKIYNV